MSVFRAKIWTGLGAAVVLGAGGLAACGGEAGEAGAAGGVAGSSVSASTAGEGDEAGPPPAPVTGGGEGDEAGPGAAAGGEQGASAAYASVPAESRRALRLAQLKGFFLAARAAGGGEFTEAASALAGQGMLEVFDPAKPELAAAVDEKLLRNAAQTGAPGALDAAVRALDAAERRAGGDPAAVARGLTAISVGLYREAMAGGGLDPTEYQHAYGAALAAQSVAAREAKLAGAKADIDRLVRLWPSASAPEDASKAAPLAQVQAQASRIELALSGA